MRTSDYMIVSLARLLEGKKNAFHGVASIMPMIAIMLARKVHNKNLIYFNITGGVNIRDVEINLSTDGPKLFEGSVSRFSLTDVFDLAARDKLDVAFLSCSQIDILGNINNSVIGEYSNPKVRLPGGAGSAVLLPNAHESIIWKTKHDKRSFVEKVDFVTARGNVTHVVTPLCIFKKRGSKLICDTLMPGVTEEDVQNLTAFDVDFSCVSPFKCINDKEKVYLDLIDPNFLRDFEL